MIALVKYKKGKRNSDNAQYRWLAIGLKEREFWEIDKL